MQDLNKEKIVYLVRHGQSIDNVAPVYQHYDSPLSPVGKDQAGKVALRVSNLAFDCLITSPQPRAVETANAIAKATGKIPEYSYLFVERQKPKRINGASHKDEKATAVWRKWNDSLYLPGVKVEDGENFDEIIKRADDALNFLLERQEKTILVVTHGYFLRTLIAKVLTDNLLTGDLLKKIQSVGLIENAGLSALKYKADMDGRYSWRLWFYNDHSHLSE